MMTSFNINCIETKHYFKARVFDTKKEMYAYYMLYISKREQTPKFKGFTGWSKKLNFEAIVMPYEKYRFIGRKKIQDNSIGEVLFYKGRLGAGIVAHEMGHCAMWHDRLVRKNKRAIYGEQVSAAEERMLHCLYHLVRNFTRQCYKRGIYD